MYCKECGKLLSDDAVFCSSCGTRVYHPINRTEKRESQEAILSQMEKPTTEGMNSQGSIEDNDKLSSKSGEKGTEEALVKRKGSSNKRNLIMAGGLVAIFAIVCIFVLINNTSHDKNNTDAESKAERGSFSKHHMVEDRSENPEGYDPDIFDFCGYDSNIFGKSLNEVINSMGLHVGYTVRVGSEEWKNFALPRLAIYAREGQSVALAWDVNRSPSPAYYFILDKYNTITGLVFRDVGGLQEISRYIGNIQTAPRKVKISPGMANAEDILCWRLTNGYKFVFSTEVAGKTYALGYADIVDPTQCLDYTNLIYGPIKDQYSDKKNMPDQLFQGIRGTYLNPDNNVFIDIDSADCICRSVINGEYGKKDYFYLDRFDSYEKVGEDSYLIKVKCGDSKLSYLSQAVYNNDGTGRQALYFNAVDEWTYSDDYIENAKYCFYKDFTHEYVYSNNDGNVSNDTMTGPSTNDLYVADNDEKIVSDNYSNTIMEDAWNLDGANEGPLPNDIFDEIKGTYESEINGIQITISSPSQILWESGSFCSTDAIDGCDPYGEELLLYTYFDGAPIILSVFHTDNGGMCMNTLEGGDWDYDKAHVHESLERISTDIGNKSGNISDNSYIIPDSSNRLLTETDLAGLSKDELRKARNEIFARYGRRFKDAELQAYFDAQSWYNGIYDPDEFDRNVKLNDIEQQNMEFIKNFEK